MPHFDEQGRGTAICQVCGTITHDVSWRKDITRNPSAGNVCKRCEREHDEPESLWEHAKQESGLDGHALRRYISRYYGHD